MKSLLVGSSMASKALRLVLCAVLALMTASPPAATLLAASTITYVQSNSATPQSAQTSVAIKYNAAQAAGNLNVIAVGWNDSSATVASVTDSKNNTYTRAVGPTVVNGFASQSIYYAKNIAAATAGANTVTVTFSTPAAYADIRVLEYSGADTNNPLDVTAANSGNSGTTSSGNLITTNATDLIFAANLVETGTTGAGTGFTRRLITSPDGDIAEDRMVTATGTYSATAPISPAGRWIMQAAAFRTQAAAGGDTIPPTAPSGLTATLSGTDVNLAWTASTDNVGVTGYRVERCQGVSCTTFAQIAAPTTTTYTDPAPIPASYSYRVRASDAAGNLSGYSTIASLSIADGQPPTAPAGLTAAASGTTVALSWTASTDNVGVSNYLIERCQGTGCATFAQVGTSTTTSFSDKNLAIDTFNYRVRATDVAGNLSPYSSVASASTTSAPATYLAGYAFSEGTGTTTADASGNNLSGALQGATWTMGKFGGGLSFNGTTGYVDLGRPAPLTTTGSMTWEAWVFPTGTPGDDGQLVSLSNGNNGWQFKTTPDTGPRTFGVGVFGASTNAQRYGKTVLSLNTWYHVASVYNASAQTLDLYVNGVLDNASLVGSVPAAMVLPAGVNVNIGRRGGGFYFIGTLDEIRMYGRALSAAEIQADMNTPVGAVSDTQPPSVPSGLTATASSGSQIDLAWAASTDNVGVTNYLVEDCFGVGCTNFTQIASPKKNSYSATGLTPNTSYSFRVRATDAAANLSGYSNIATVSTPAPAPPSAPGTLTATAATTSQINLAWGAATADLGVGTYTLERCQGAACSNFAAIAALTPTTLSYSDTGLTATTSYSYRVRATDTAGTAGPYSNTAIAVTPAIQPPTAPSNLTASAVSSTQVNLAWAASTSSLGLANYVLQRCQGAACSTFASIASPTGTSYSDTGLTAGTSYSYQVQAVDTAANTSPFSNIASATPQNGLVAAYGFNEGSGVATSDASGNGITGTVQNAAWTTAGKFGNALSFNGNNSFVDLGRPVALTSTGSMSWEAWVFPTGTPGDDGQLIALSNDTAGWQFKTTPDTGQRTFGIAIAGATGSFSQRYGKTVLNLNTWYHVAAVYNATAKTLDLYVNGVLDNASLVGSVPAAIVLPAGVNVNVAQRSGGFNFIGTLDEIRMYTRALSQAEIQNDMNTAVPSAQAGVSPTSLDFGSQTVNTSSAAKTITLTNTGAAALNVSGVSILGTGGASFTQTNTCTAPLAPNATCTVGVTFTPLTAGTQAGSVHFADNAGNPHDVPVTGSGTGGPMTVTPHTATLTPIVGQQFSTGGVPVTWSVDGTAGGSASIGTIAASGMYTPPSTAGTHTVTATATDGSGATASATVYVSTYGGTFTRDVSTKRIGVNESETVLTPANVNTARFGKVYSFPTDGVSDASPLYVANVNVPGKGARNVVYVATEHDTIFAFDADNQQAAPLWQVSFINPAAGVTTVPPGDTGECCDIQPEIGITGTPVIDPATNTLYVVAKTKEPSGYFHRLHALDLATGAEKLGGPVVIQASVPGTGGGAVGGNVPFLSLHENQRAALLLLNGAVYVAFGSHGDVTPYHGWVLGYDATTLKQTMVWCSSPNTPGNGSGVWQSGDGVATDGSNLFFVTGEGLFNVNSGGTDYGDSVVKLNPTGGVLDFFTPHDQANLDAQNLDFGSGGILLLPDQPGAHPHLAITAGKSATVYVVDRDNLGHYNATNDNQIVQVLPDMFPHGNQEQGNFKAPVYWNGHVYFSSDADFLKMFSITNGLLSTAPTSQSSWVANYPGATLGLSANGNADGVLWAIQRVDTDPSGNGVRGPGVLHAFDATNLGAELFNSSQSGTRDTLDFTAKWSAPLVANGRVYIASLSQLTVYGLLP